MKFSPQNLLIVGAGFSFNAGLPLAGQFTHALLNLEKLRLDGPSAAMTAFIRGFVNKAFGEGQDALPEEWPELEDIFTLVDLSANTGHHLGIQYSASDLRVVRRAMIVRIIRMFAQRLKAGEKKDPKTWALMETLFREFDTEKTAVLSMNWDTVFEQGIARTQGITNIEYGCDARPKHFQDDELTSRKVSAGHPLHLMKPHGSINWLYCDACREVYYLPPNQSEQVAQTLFRDRDWKAVAELTELKHTPKTRTPKCPHCSGQSLGTRLATFSYRKALDFPMHAATWKTAESVMKRTATWVFFGYSMPSADFEFKYLLKRVQLTEDVKPEIIVITGGDDAAQTVRRFENFFGRVAGERTYHTKGLTPAVLASLRERGILNPKQTEANLDDLLS